MADTYIPFGALGGFVSLSNFPLWWLGLLLGWIADRSGPRAMLFAEAALGLLGVILFVGISRKFPATKEI